MNNLEIKEKIMNLFTFEEQNTPLINELLTKLPLIKLPLDITIGNHEVYKITITKSTTIEAGLLFLFPGSGIIEHEHPKEKGISETYTAIGQNKITWLGKTYTKQSCSLGELHGVDIEKTPRIIYYKKTNELALEKSKPLKLTKKGDH